MPRTDDTSPLIQNSFKLFLYTPHQNIWKIYLDDVLSMIEHVLRAQTLIRHPSNPVGSIHLDAHNIKTLRKDHQIPGTIDVSERNTVCPEFETWKYSFPLNQAI
ncbi:hypothetical protein [Xylella fastidiosa]|uniref:hypothetical protein n=1 Tax=Xylella fastidiosa TaxID=2371 RepID=UPI0018AFF56D|nr:hypothetical protein [Xylella fastidiosa]UIX81367.1 hypothetical protein LZ756_00190 [Xylella fastidiosa subsp. sandyi]